MDQELKAIASEGTNFAALTTRFTDGSMQCQVMWVDADEEHILINTEVHRAKFRNVENDPVVTVLIWELTDPYRYIEVRGKVAETVRGPSARAHIDRLAQRYTGRSFADESITSERVLLK
ncbi:MAG: TIGR03618 family F420-dependent PPOX class oxidoreductase, partial [Actinobacteria bacterium]|nr:TIGR03618 family F420-dependent PPOX class oxidoreductase [Actinomycetota bacterium]